MEESAALNDQEVTELLGLTRNAVKEGVESKSETKDLLKDARSATDESKRGEDETKEVSEDDIEALLEQIGEAKVKTTDTLDETNGKGDEPTSSTAELDDSEEIAMILSQLTDAARLEQQFKGDNRDVDFPSVSGLSLPSVPKDESGDDDFNARLANLRSFKPSTWNYTGTDPGTINVFIPGMAKAADDESEHWCGKSRS